jgi:hypothetical protein
MGLLSHYRVFTANKRYGTAAWDWPSEATLQTNGAVSVVWTEVAERPFKLEATYRWVAPNILDLETRVSAIAQLKSFETFLASYFSALFTNSMVYTTSAQGDLFVHATQSVGTWQCFPRDSTAAALFKDGRWQIEPNPVEWVRVSDLAHPIGLRRAPHEHITVAIYSRSADCFAISTPYEIEDHRSLYFSLFGGDVKPGETLVAKNRLVVHTNALEQAMIVKDWKQFASP